MDEITRQLRLAEHWWRMDAAGADHGADEQARWHVDQAAGMILEQEDATKLAGQRRT